MLICEKGVCEGCILPYEKAVCEEYMFPMQKVFVKGLYVKGVCYHQKRVYERGE